MSMPNGGNWPIVKVPAVAITCNKEFLLIRFYLRYDEF